MGRGNESFGKKEVRAKKEKKRKEKEQRRQERKGQSRDGNNLDDMIAYVDEFGNITSTPPDPTRKTVINAEEIEIGVPRDNSPKVNETIRSGIVTFFDTSKGFGFIKDSASGQDIFVHAKSLSAAIAENDIVTFEVIKGPKGPNAVNVAIVKE
ncbi:MAG TPA: cold shock domain-containing protein [Bacteroidales bacterium]|nr:cold shock domain-containing protein [Bacteroidales bacterium]